MRSNYNYIEITDYVNGKKLLLNKSSIIFVTKADEDERAVILTKGGEYMNKIFAKESYEDISEELLWKGFYNEQLCGWSWEDSVGLRAPEEKTDD